jgi:hypothetical protein
LKGRRAEAIAVVFLLIVALGFCGRAVFTGRALLPLDMLLLMSPWKAHGPAILPTLSGHEPGAVFMPQNPMLDPVKQYYPWRSFAVSALKAGIIPLWNPFSYCGQPFLANLQSALFYPLNLIFLLLPLPAAFTWGVVIHLFLAGLFSYALFRQWGLQPLAGLVGAIAFMLNGYIIGWLEYPAFGLWVLIWLPAVLLCFEKAISTGRWKWVLLTGVAIGLQFLGGQLQISSYLIIAFLLYAVYKALFADDKQAIAGTLGKAVIALIMGFCIAAVQLLPTLELAPLCARLPKTLAEARAFALPATHLILFLIPNFFGNPVDRIYWGNLTDHPQMNFQESGCYLGIITLLLAFLAIRLWRKPQVGFLLVLALISLLMALGTPLYALFFYLVPGAKQLAGLARMLCLTDFALAGLAAFGMQRLLDKKPALGKWELPAFALGMLLIIAVILAAPVKPHPDLIQLSAQQEKVMLGQILWRIPPLLDNFILQAVHFLALLAASTFLVWLLMRGVQVRDGRKKRSAKSQPRSLPAAGLVLGLLLLDLFSFGFGFNPATEPRLAFFPTAVTDFLHTRSGHTRITSYRPPDERPQAALEWMLPNTPLVYQLRDVHGYDSLVPGRYTALIGSTDWSAQGNWPAPDSPLADLIGIEYALTTAELKVEGWRLERSLEANIYHNEEAMPRAFAVSQARRLGEDECLRLVRSGEFNFRQEVLLSGRAAADSGPKAANGALPAEVRFMEDGINSVTLEIELPQAGWLVLTDTGYPGWKVVIDNEPKEWQTANYTFRAVELPSGRHLVRWAYTPMSFKAGLFISLAALAAVCCSFGFRLGKRGDR